MKRQLTYYWWAYVLYSIVAIAITISIYHAIDSPNENEMIRIAIAGDNIDTTMMEQNLNDYLLLYSNQAIKNVSIDYIDLGNFEDALVTRTLDGYDLFILPHSSIRLNTGSFYFLPLTELLSDYSWNPENLYEENDVPYGILINSPPYSTRFSDYLDANDNGTYFVFINVFSVNVGGYNAYSNVRDVAAIETIEWLLSGDENE